MPLYDAGAWEALVEAGSRRFSRRAFMAALLINLYRDEPILQLPFRLLTSLSDIDEGFITWRQRHGLMVMRMIGDRIGTGGTSGHEYLRQAAETQQGVRRPGASPHISHPPIRAPPSPPGGCSGDAVRNSALSRCTEAVTYATGCVVRVCANSSLVRMLPCPL